ncbi:FtsX-like permease family protein [Longimicrobium terrae]|uniref:Putative permease n=1 Tax=Longimicrobium terrae TaxID=1639882 RepID=A0A841GN04_9BACT|nr:FtsX-like permease family protein [Longimicrobium terrae]MBB4634418.1 putative permease [Longimicrobium terrae]MBB6068692.1 putative permease [Longimicrobium terrae]NNC27878.1 FtsX-like permease family protein [Longimicrobium terrae]
MNLRQRTGRGPLRALLRAPGYALPAFTAMALGIMHGGPLLSLARARLGLAAPHAAGPAFDRAPGGGWTTRLVAPETVQALGVDALVRAALAAVLLLMAAAAVNLATLVLARATARRADTAVRAALGATPGRLVRAAVAEAGALGMAGIVAGALLGAAVSLLVRASWPASAGSMGAYRPALGIGAAAAALLIPTLLLAVIPAWTGARGRLHGWLAAGARATAGPGEVLLRKGLTILQFGAALMLLCGALVLVRGSLPRSDPQALGFDPRDTLTFRMHLPPGAADAAHEQSRLLAAVRAVPGVVSASAASPGAWLAQGETDWVHSRCRGCGDAGVLTPLLAGGAVHHAVAPGYFRALGIRVLAGREFGADEGAGGRPAVLVNRAFATFMLPRANPVGQRVSFTGPFGRMYDVVGVVDDVHARSAGSTGVPVPAVYLSALQHPPRTLDVAVRTRGEPMDVAEAVRAAAAASVPGARIRDVRTMDELLRRHAAPLRWFGWLMAAVAAGSLALSAGGLFAVMNFAVARRRREIGVRMALGASQRDVVRQMLKEAARVACFGAVLGGAGALTLARGLELGFAGMHALDWPVYAGVAALLAAVCLAAAWFPARQAAGVQPMEALRAD